jgi:hypothetical protein
MSEIICSVKATRVRGSIQTNPTILRIDSWETSIILKRSDVQTKTSQCYERNYSSCHKRRISTQNLQPGHLESGARHPWLGAFTGLSRPVVCPSGVICGHLAYSRIKRSSGALVGQGLALAGLVTGYVSIGLSVFLLPMMLAIAIPNFVKARNASMMNACINNLRQIDAAKQQWALENEKKSDAVPTAQDLTPYLKSFPKCPAGGTYTIGAVSNAPTCSIPEHKLPE